MRRWPQCPPAALSSSFWTVDYEDVPVLPAGEVVLAEVGSTDDQRIIKHIKSQMLEAHSLIPLARQQTHHPFSKVRCVVKKTSGTLHKLCLTHPCTSAPVKQELHSHFDKFLARPGSLAEGLNLNINTVSLHCTVAIL